MAQESELLTLLREELGAALLDSHAFRGDETVVITAAVLPELARRLKEDPARSFEFLMDLTAVDYLDQPQYGKRFQVVYHFYSLTHNRRLRLKVPVADGESVPTLSHLWKAADWFEREIWDMYGIRFSDHPNLKRLLMYEEFKGHPLRKDYPVTKRQPLLKPLYEPERHPGDKI